MVYVCPGMVLKRAMVCAYSTVADCMRQYCPLWHGCWVVSWATKVVELATRSPKGYCLPLSKSPFSMRVGLTHGLLVVVLVLEVVVVVVGIGGAAVGAMQLQAGDIRGAPHDANGLAVAIVLCGFSTVVL